MSEKFHIPNSKQMNEYPEIDLDQVNDYPKIDLDQTEVPATPDDQFNFDEKLTTIKHEEEQHGQHMKQQEESLRGGNVHELQGDEMNRNFELYIAEQALLEEKDRRDGNRKKDVVPHYTDDKVGHYKRIS